MKPKDYFIGYLLCLVFFFLLSPTESMAQKKLIHYWDMNNTLPAGGAGGVSVSPLAAEYSTLGHAYLVYTNSITTAASCGCTVRDSLVDNGAGGAIINDRPVLGNDTGGTSGGNLYIRTRNPMNNMKFLWYMPTTGYQNILLKYASELSSAGKPGQNYSYSLDSGLTFITIGLPMTTYTPGIAWGLQSIDLSAISGANNNPKFVFCISYSGAASQATSGNDRYDNITLEGDSICPSFILQPTSQNICSGNSTNFFTHVIGGANNSYQWQVNTGSGFTNLINFGVYSGVNTDSLIMSGSTGTMNNFQYQCVVSSGTCTNINSNNVVLTVNPSPVVTANSATICAGNSTVLNASGAASYTWSPPAGLNSVSSASVIASPTTTTIYTLTGVNASNCSSTTTATVTVNPKPIISISGATILCSNQSTTLTASGANTYTWVGGGNTDTNTVSPIINTTYTVIGTSVNNCSNTSTKIITVKTAPTISTNTATVCLGNSALLSAGGANTYTWSPAASLNSASGVTVTATPSATTIYTISGTAINGCQNMITTTVVVNSLPIINISGTNTICLDNSTTLTASGASSYTWANGPNTSTNTVSPTSNATYTVTGTDVNNCVNTVTQNVTVNSLPTITVSGTNTICVGSSTTLTASGASSYTWTNGPNTSTNTVSPISNATYTVTGTDVNNCVNTATQNVTVNSLLIITISGTTTICAGGSTTLTANGASSYTWTNGSNTSTNIVSPTSNTIYTVTGADANNCVNTVTQNVTVNSLPTITVSGPNTICAGGSTTLTAGGANSYTWINGPNTSTNTVSPISNATYTVTGTDANNCVNTATQNVTVNPLPTITVSGTNTICVGSSTTLIANGASSYTWTNGPNTSTNTVSPISNATYTVTGTDANNCINAATQNVIVNSLPIINISGINTICVGSSTTLTANGATSYTWTNGPNTSTNTVSPMSNATYTVTGTDANNCVNTAIQNVTVNFLPIINISDTNTICAGDTTTLTANGALFYVWSNNTNMANTTVSPASNTTYTVIGTDANNCSNSSSILIHVNPLPVIVILGTSSICIGQSTTISAIGATTYTWSGGSNTSSINISPTSDTNYVVTGTDINNCVNTATQTITVNLPPTITINGANSTCIGQSTTLSATGANTYTWTAGPGTAINIVTPLANTVYTVTGTDINNCVNTALHNVTIKSLPTISINGLTTICSGQTTTLTASGANTYVWSNGPTVSNDIVSPTVNTTYTVTGTDTNNCTNSALQLVTATPLPNVVINQGETNITSISGSLVTLEASGAVNYQWTSGNVSCTTCASITESPVANVQYCVTGTNSNNCSNNSCINILVQELCGDVFVPDAFSPNGDGVNDLFKVCGNCINKLTLQIFDRWGNKIFETTDPLSGWNGSVQGSEMNTGTYLYQANYTLNSGASSKMHGNFILIR